MKSKNCIYVCRSLVLSNPVTWYIYIYIGRKSTLISDNQNGRLFCNIAIADNNTEVFWLYRPKCIQWLFKINRGVLILQHCINILTDTLRCIFNTCLKGSNYSTLGCSDSTVDSAEGSAYNWHFRPQHFNRCVWYSMGVPHRQLQIFWWLYSKWNIQLHLR